MTKDWQEKLINFKKHPEIEVVGEAENAEEAKEKSIHSSQIYCF